MDDGFELIGASGQIIDLAQLESKVTSPRWAVRYPTGQAFEAFDDNIGKQFFRTTAGEFIGGTLINVALSSLEFAAPWRNPYLSNEQRVIQNIVTVSGAAVSSGAAVWVGSLAGASSVGGPVTFVLITGTGVVVYATWEHIVKPGASWFATHILQISDPYRGNRNLHPLGAN